MGRKNKEYQKDLHQQAYDRLKSMEAYGKSKKEAMRAGTAKDKIYSYNTFKTYWKHIRYFVDWVKKEHPEATTLKAAKKYVNEWLGHRAASCNQKGEPLSAWTIQTEAKALGKMYGITPNDPDYYVPPVRARANIKRSRNDVVRDSHFSEFKNADFVTFCRATGLRRCEITRLTGKDLVRRSALERRITDLGEKTSLTEEEQKQLKMLDDIRLFPGCEHFIYVKRGKGGRQRLVPLCLGDEESKLVIAKMSSVGREDKVWPKVPKNADIHSYRADFATAVYKKYAREIGSIPYDVVNRGTGRKYQSQVYICRKDAYKKLDRAAMLQASKALGHNRLDVVATNYLRKL